MEPDRHDVRQQRQLRSYQCVLVQVEELPVISEMAELRGCSDDRRIKQKLDAQSKIDGQMPFRDIPKLSTNSVVILKAPKVLQVLVVICLCDRRLRFDDDRLVSKRYRHFTERHFIKF